MQKTLALLAAAAVLVSCGTQEVEVSTPPAAQQESQTLTPATYPDSVMAAHQAQAFFDAGVVHFDLTLSFGGSVRFEGPLALATNSSAAQMTNRGRTYWTQGMEMFADTVPASPASARFAAYTWPYFFLLPYKLNDPGTQWSPTPYTSLDEQVYNARKLTFASGTGDAPDDWYITYADSDTGLLYAAAYIVTAGGTSVSDAEVDPHAITYHDYREVDGIPVAHAWKFWAWRPGEGLTEQLGEATLEQVRFDADRSALTPPADAFAVGAEVLE